MRRSAAEVIEALLHGPKFGTGIGFRRLGRLLRPLLVSEWGRRFEAIKVTGSNGKGSVTALVHTILQGLGVECGRFTSPHLVRFHERIVLRDRQITDDELESAAAWLDAAGGDCIEPGEAFGSFELLTALGLRAFLEANLDVAILEAGIGGRYDPTRLAPGSLVALTSIDLEHTELLGKTKELIAYDKLDLCPEGGTVVAVRQDDDLWSRMAAYCHLRGLTLLDARERWVVERDSAAPGLPLDHTAVRIASPMGEVRCVVPLAGAFQLRNISIACAVAEEWTRRHRLGVTPEVIASGLRSVQWPGRFQVIAHEPPVIVDVGHTPDACANVIDTVQECLPGRPLLIVTGVSVGKDLDGILGALVPAAHGVVCTRAYHKGEAVARITDRVRELAPSIETWEAPTIEEAVALVKRIAAERGMPVLVAGGLFLAIEFRTAWEGGDLRRLRFY